MGTYFHGNSDIHGGGGGGDGLQTLILMNTGGGFVGFSDAPSAAAAQQQPPGSNFAFLNSHGSSMGFSHAPQSQAQQYVAHPFGNNSAAASASTEVHVSSAHDFSAFHGFLGRPQYSLYGTPVELAAARGVTRSQQGLSLSLSSQQTGFGNFQPKPEAGTEHMAMAVPSSAAAGDEVRVPGGSPSPVSDAVNGGVHQNVLLNSKFLNAAQELLDEVVNVGRGMKSGTEPFKGSKEVSKNPGAAAADVPTGGQSGGKRAVELTTAERQEIQMKKSKLVNMLDEVEQRYKQYHHQMQVVIAWFEQAAGVGSSRTYTSLALQTISKQFRCLKDAILGQIRAAGKSLGEEIEGLGGKIEGSSPSSSSSRLRFVDNHLRQQRALQQLGMFQHNGNAWRPQRGLPERSVSVLRAWLFEHFLHPYPKDSDKIMLAKQTGLTRNQVSNWFINARVRLWKPMVEEMYLEETKEQEQQNNNGTENQTGEPNEASAAGCSDHHQENSSFTQNQQSTISTTSPSVQNQPSFSPKKARRVECPDSAASMDFTLMGGAPANFIGGFGSYPIGQIGSYSGNAVSLTLGLPHSENLAHQGFIHTQEMHMGRGVEMGEPNNQFGSMDTPMGYNIEDRKRFAAPLLPDFVA
ncbi:unnamed protein product [Cuscuta campestris]|uniref:Homeobox domain-containing protein n=1 Tax=Cuscuta campestris TaxID=132261 RepID=A0A484LC82_9ASTE|nr:unnamed protein product [Cuscuta campestris]